MSDMPDERNTPEFWKEEVKRARWSHFPKLSIAEPETEEHMRALRKAWRTTPVCNAATRSLMEYLFTKSAPILLGETNED